MELAAVDVELAGHGHDDPGEQAGPIRVEEPFQGAPHPIVVQSLDIARERVEQSRVVAGGPFGQGVDRLAVGDQVADHHAQHDGRRQAQAGVVVGQETLQGAGGRMPARKWLMIGSGPSSSERSW